MSTPLLLRASALALLLFASWPLAAADPAEDPRPLPAGMVMDQRHGIVVAREVFERLRTSRQSFQVPRANATNLDPDWIIYLPGSEPGKQRKALWIAKSYYPPKGQGGGQIHDQWTDENEKAHLATHLAFKRLGGSSTGPFSQFPTWIPARAYVLARVYPENMSPAAIGLDRDQAKAWEAEQDWCATLESWFHWPIAKSVLAVHDHSLQSKQAFRAITGDAIFFLSFGQGATVRYITTPLVIGQMGVALHDFEAAETDGEKSLAMFDFAMAALDLYGATRPMRAQRGFKAPKRSPERPRYARDLADPDRAVRELLDPASGAPIRLPDLNSSSGDLEALLRDPARVPFPDGTDLRRHYAKWFANLPDSPEKRALLSSEEWGLVHLSGEPVDLMPLMNHQAGTHVIDEMGIYRARVNSNVANMADEEALVVMYHELLHANLMRDLVYPEMCLFKVLRDDGTAMLRHEFIRENSRRIMRQEAHVTIQTARFAEKVHAARGRLPLIREHREVLEMIGRKPSATMSSAERWEKFEDWLLDRYRREGHSYRQNYERALGGIYDRFKAPDDVLEQLQDRRWTDRLVPIPPQP